MVDEDGEHVLETRVVDSAGRTSGWRSETVKIDIDGSGEHHSRRAHGLAQRRRTAS